MKCKSSVIAFKQLCSINLWNLSIVLSDKIDHPIDLSTEHKVIITSSVWEYEEKGIWKALAGE